MKVSDIGEFKLIQRLHAIIKTRCVPPVWEEAGRYPLVLDIGDDTAAWNTSGSLELCTTDTLVHGVHFTMRDATWREVGWKALAVNYSDIASMGGVPLYILVSLGLPGETLVRDVEELYSGMLDLCQEYGGVIVGGDIVASPVLFVTAAVTGCTEDPVMRRDAARLGDLVAVTGPLGTSSGGLQMLARGLCFDHDTMQTLREAHLRPRPCLVAGRILAQHGVCCSQDISDGLVGDLGNTCKASGVAARIQAERVPLTSSLKEAFPDEALGLALSGGEDYELLFTAPPDEMRAVLPYLPSGAAVIGELIQGVPGTVVVVDAFGHVVPVPLGGWDHFVEALAT
jgi:thiamine-monophosphate kinase